MYTLEIYSEVVFDDPHTCSASFEHHTTVGIDPNLIAVVSGVSKCKECPMITTTE